MTYDKSNPAPKSLAEKKLGVQIEHGVPAPPKRTAPKWKPLYEQMKDGDSVVVTRREALIFLQAVRPMRVKEGFHIVTRKISQTHARVWKIKNPDVGEGRACPSIAS